MMIFALYWVQSSDNSMVAFFLSMKFYTAAKHWHFNPVLELYHEYRCAFRQTRASPFRRLLLCLEERRNYLCSQNTESSCQTQQLSLEPDTHNSFSSVTQDLLPWFARLITNALFFCTTSDTSHICPPPSVALLRALNPSSVSTRPVSRVWHGLANEVMFVGPYCSRADFSGHISHPCGEKLNIATLASSFS